MTGAPAAGRGRAVVVGGSGAVGSRCVEALRRDGWSVKAVPAPRLTSTASSTRELVAEVRRCERQIEQLAEQLAGVAVVVNAAGRPTVTAAASPGLTGAHALLPGVLLAAARRAGARRLVQLSSVSVQGRREPLDETLHHDATSPYARSRAQGELVLDALADAPADGAPADASTEAVILRLPSVVGSGTTGQRALQRIARSRLCSTTGERPRPAADPANVAAAVAFLAAHPGPVPRVVLQPEDGLTTTALLELLGGTPRRIPVPLARAVTRVLRGVGPRAVRDLGRGLELMWLGHAQTASWLTGAGFSPPVDRRRRPLRVGLLTHWYAPERGPHPAPTTTQLTARGHDVAVLTGFPNYPTGRIYPGFRQRWAHRETRDAAAVRRVPLYPSHDTNGLRRALSLLSFAVSSTAASGFLADRDVVYVYGSPLTATTAAAVLRWWHGVPYVLHVIDLWPDSVTESGMAGGPRTRRAVTAALRGVADRLYRDAAHVVAVTPGMRDVLVARGVPAEKVSVVANSAPNEDAADSAFDQDVRDRLGRPGRLLAVFAGNVGQMQDVETIVRAAALCGPETPMDVAVVGAGTAFAAAAALAAELGATNLRFFDRVDSAAMPGIYAASDYQLVTLKDRPLFRVTVPSKFGDALAAGCPVITNVLGDASRMCREGGFGYTCAPESPEALATVFRQACAADDAVRAEQRRRARDYYFSALSSTIGIGRLERILADAAPVGVPRA